MKRHSISTRITIWYAVFMVIIFAVLMTVLLQMYHLRERSNAEMRLIRTVEEVSDSIVDEGESFMYKSYIKYYVRDTYISVYRSDGDLLVGRRPRGFEEFPPFDLEKTAVLKDMHGMEWYVYDSVMGMGEGNTLYIRGMMSNEAYAGTDVFLVRSLAVVIPFLILLAVAGGWLITRRTLSPLRELIKVSSEIRSDRDLSRRVPVPESGDEVQELAEAFNGMFGSIEDLVSREKQFTSDVSHELRTPLAVIRSQSEYAIEDESYAPEAARVINRESKRLSDLVSSLLMLARSDSGRLEPDMIELDLVTLLESAAQQAGINAADRDISVRFLNETSGTDNSEVIVLSDPLLLMRIVRNLLDNAVKYGRSPGGNIELRLARASDESVITVADDGPGIPVEERSRIWQRFYRADRSRTDDDSSGLGLSMVESLVSVLGGSIRYVDEADRREHELPGAVFELHLPEKAFI